MPLDRKQGVGLLAREGEYEPLKPFAAGGFYWDAGFQNLIRSYLGAFLPALTRGQDERGSYGAFRASPGFSEPLLQSKPLGESRVPTTQLRGLREALERFKAVANAPETQPDYRALISKFQLPDPRKEPELYRLCGPFWKRRLYILWGCERTRNSSIPAEAAISILPEDKFYDTRRLLAGLGLLFLLSALLAALWRGWPVASDYLAKALNKPPIPAIKVDSLDFTNRVVLISDNGSRDPDGQIKEWHINWGDAEANSFTAAPVAKGHTYARAGEYVLSLSCVDNLGATSREPAHKTLRFDPLSLAAPPPSPVTNIVVVTNVITNTVFVSATPSNTSSVGELLPNTEIPRQATQNEAPTNAPPLNEADARKGEQPSSADDAALGPSKPAPASAITPEPSPNAKTAEPPQGSTAPSEPPPVPEPEGTTPFRPDLAKGAEGLMYRDLEIVKAGIGQFRSDGTLEAMLVVRDVKHPNTPLDVIEWVVNGKAYRTGNAQFTARLSISNHVVSVRVRRVGIQQTAKARVTVTGGQTHTTEPNFTIQQLR